MSFPGDEKPSIPDNYVRMVDYQCFPRKDLNQKGVKVNEYQGSLKWSQEALKEAGFMRPMQPIHILYLSSLSSY